MSYDSTEETKEHIRQVGAYLDYFCSKIHFRAIEHDKSKLESPEKEIFDKVIPLLKSIPYGSEEYSKILREVKPAIKHHYSANRHHPEYYENGIRGMNLIDIIEMFCDWMVLSKSGDIRKSIEIGQERFNYSDDLKQIFLNTVDEMGV